MNQNIKYNLLKTFRGGHQIADLKNYFKVTELFRKGLSQKQIRDKVNVSLDKLYRWRHTNSKPLFVKIMKEFEDRYNKIYSNKELEDIAYLIGYNLGDGNLSKNFCNTWFYGVYSDLFDIKKILLKFGVKPVIYKYKIDNGKMAVHDHIFSRFLYIYGAIPGDKTKNKVVIPKWILKSNKNIKRKFLQGLFDSELNKISKVENKNHYRNLKFDNAKTLNKARDGIFFLNQIRDLLLEDFGIKTGKVCLGRRYKRSRDNEKMQQLYFILYSNYINLYDFIIKIGFLYNSKRKKSASKILKKIEKLAILEKEKINGYKKVLLLRKKGISAYEIAKRLKLKIHLVKQWSYYKTKPRLFNFYSNNS